MSSTLVIQSHRSPLPFAWMQRCLASVEDWAQDSGYDYRFLGDEIFDLLAADVLQKTAGRRVIASDVARLACLQQAIAEGYDCVLWVDADVLIYEPVRLILPPDEFALGREVWVQQDQRQQLRAYVKVHNAVLLFRRDNSFLDFYRATAERLLRLNQGRMPPQFVGPKLLTAIHNIASCPVLETAGMLSPLVMQDLLAGGGESLNLFLRKSTVMPAAANLSASLSIDSGLDESSMDRLIDLLLSEGIRPSAI